MRNASGVGDAFARAKARGRRRGIRYAAERNAEKAAFYTKPTVYMNNPPLLNRAVHVAALFIPRHAVRPKERQHTGALAERSNAAGC